MMNLQYPANAQTFTSAIINILNVDILDPALVQDPLFEFDENEAVMDLINDDPELLKDSMLIAQIQDLGFETFNPILNIGGIFVLILMLTFQLIIIWPLRLFVIKLKKITRQQRQERQATSLNAEGGEENMPFKHKMT